MFLLNRALGLFKTKPARGDVSDGVSIAALSVTTALDEHDELEPDPTTEERFVEEGV